MTPAVSDDVNYAFLCYFFFDETQYSFEKYIFNHTHTI